MEFLSKNKTLHQAILSTLAYFDIFQIPLSKSEIKDNLIYLKTDEEKINKELLHTKKEDGYYSLNLK